MIGIYKITCLKNKRVYLGASVDIQKRFSVHQSLLKRNKHFNSRIQKDFNKYGENEFGFEVVELCEKESLPEKERYWNDFYGYPNPKKVYNLESGGNAGKKLAKSTKNKLSKLHKGKLNHCYGKIYTAEERKRISDSMKDRITSPAGLQKFLESNKKRSKKVYQYDLNTKKLINIYPSIQEAGRQTGVSAGNIYLCCIHRVKNPKYFIFRYEKDPV